MPKGSEELTNARKDEIINACAALYETMSFREITLKEIGRQTSFTRTSIYNYFQTKEEIFLALMQREYESWICDLEHRLAHTLERRERLLKLMSMNLYDVEDNSRIENLAAFKTAYGGSMQAVSACLEKFFPQMTAADRQGFLYAFFPFLFGIYPYTAVTEKQQEAMKQAGISYTGFSVYDIADAFIGKLLRGFLR